MQRHNIYLHPVGFGVGVALIFGPDFVLMTGESNLQSFPAHHKDF